MRGRTFNTLSPLVRYILMQKWTMVRKYLKTSAGSNEVKSYKSPKGRSALHLALENNPPIDIVKKLIKIDPYSIRCVDYLGLSTLHVACCSFLPLEVVNFLISEQQRQQGEASLVILRDRRENTALHHAVKALLDPLYYERLDYKNDSSATILCNCGDLGQDSCYTSQILIVGRLVSMEPQLVHMRDRNGCTPVEILEDCTSGWSKIAISVILGGDQTDFFLRQMSGEKMSSMTPDNEKPARRGSILTCVRCMMRTCCPRPRIQALTKEEIELHSRLTD